MSEEQKKKADQEMMATISRAVIEGNRFSEACRSTEKFSDYEYYTLQIGEESGTLNKVLEDLADFYARKIKQRRTLISSMSYPIVILITALGAVFFMLRFMVPMFEDVFKRVGGDLPGITKIVIKLSDFMGTYFTGFMLVLFVAGINPVHPAEERLVSHFECPRTLKNTADRRTGKKSLYHPALTSHEPAADGEGAAGASHPARR